MPETAVENALRGGTTATDIARAKDGDEAREESIETQLDEQE